MKKFYLAVVSLCLSAIHLNTSCEIPSIVQEEICQTIYLADLYCMRMYYDDPNIRTGSAFLITTVIKNIAQSTKLCETQPAGKSDTGFDVEYRSDRNSPWEQTQFETEDNDDLYEVLIPTDELGPGKDKNVEMKFEVDEPGLYKVKSNVDRNDVVEERDEDNNKQTSDEGALGKAASRSSGYYAIIEVLPAEDYAPRKRKKGELPKVKFLGYRINQ